jgi:hypothetical protein
MTEWVFVQFPGERAVFVDGTPAGTTGEVLTVEAGVHRIDLGEPRDYRPSSVSTSVSGTAPLSPQLIHFQQAEEPIPRSDEAEAPSDFLSSSVEPWLSFVLHRASSMAARNKQTLDAVQFLAAVMMEASPTSESDSAWFVRKQLSNQRGLPTERLRDLLDLDNFNWPDLRRSPNAGWPIDRQPGLSAVDTGRRQARCGVGVVHIDDRHAPSDGGAAQGR